MRAFLFTLFVFLFACGGGPKPVTPQSATIDFDSDPLALLPPGALGVVSLDAKALFADPQLGKPVQALVDKLMPLGEESGLVPSRDVRRIVLGSYALEGLDVAGVISGELDAEKIARAAKNHTQTKAGPIAESTYAEHTLYTVANAGFSILSPKTALVGTDTGIRRALDKLKNLKRDLPPWMYETLETKGAAFALAADLANQNIAAMSLGPLNLGFMKGIRVARVVGSFAPPGVHVAGTATFAEEAQARAGADGFRSVAKLIAPFSAAGIVPQLEDVKIEPKGTDVQASFSIDAKQLADALAKIPQYLG